MAILGGMMLRAACLLSFLVAMLPGQDAGIAWQTDLAAAKKLAVESGKPLFVVFRCEA